MSLSDLIARLEDAVRLAGAREEMLNRPSAAVLRYEDAKRLLRLLRAGERAVECLFVPCVECGGRGGLGDTEEHGELCQRCGGAGRYPMDDDCAAALREWDEAAR